MSLTRQLRDEHDQIRRRLRDWDDLLVELESGIGTFAALRLKEEAQWVRSKVLPHIYAEESVIFPSLSERTPEGSVTLRRLSNDHTQLRELIAATLLMYEAHDLIRNEAASFKSALALWERGKASFSKVRASLERVFTLLHDHFGEE